MEKNKIKKAKAAGVLLMIILGLSAFFWVSTVNFLLFHSFVEIFSIVIAVGLFMIAWNSRIFSKNYFLLLLGISVLFVGLIDFVHMLAYKGMQIFSEHDANLPTQLWIAARYMQSVSFLIAIIFIRRKFKPGAVLWTYAVITTVLLLSIFYWHIFPDAFIEGSGLTNFKIYSEYVISAVLLMFIWLLYRNRIAFSKEVFNLLILAGVTTIISEIAFTFYVSVFGLSNVVGHIFKIIAFYALYRAVIETSLIKPYDLLFRELKESEEKYINLYDRLKVTNKIMSHDVLGKLTNVRVLIELSGIDKKDKNIKSAYDNLLSGIRVILQMRQLELSTDSKLKLREINLRQILEEISLNSSIKVNIKGNGKVMADNAISSVFENLIRNAQIHGGVESVDIDIKDAKSNVIIRVKDNGSGIPKKIRRRLFMEGFSSGKTGNTGLGLYIIKKTIKRYHGSVHFEPNHPKGSIFVIELPKNRSGL